MHEEGQDNEKHVGHYYCIAEASKILGEIALSTLRSLNFLFCRSDLVPMGHLWLKTYSERSSSANVTTLNANQPQTMFAASNYKNWASFFSADRAPSSLEVIQNTSTILTTRCDHTALVNGAMAAHLSDRCPRLV